MHLDWHAKLSAEYAKHEAKDAQMGKAARRKASENVVRNDGREQTSGFLFLSFAIISIYLQLYTDRRVKLDVTDEARIWLAEHGYDRAYGARPLKRVISQYLLNPLAKTMLANKIRDGSTVEVYLNVCLSDVAIPYLCLFA